MDTKNNTQKNKYRYKLQSYISLCEYQLCCSRCLRYICIVFVVVAAHGTQHPYSPARKIVNNGCCCSFIFWTTFSIWSSGTCTKRLFESDNNKQLTQCQLKSHFTTIYSGIQCMYKCACGGGVCFNQLNDIGNDQINCFWHFKIEKNTQTMWKSTDTSMHLIFA